MAHPSAWFLVASQLALAVTLLVVTIDVGSSCTGAAFAWSIAYGIVGSLANAYAIVCLSCRPKSSAAVGLATFVSLAGAATGILVAVEKPCGWTTDFIVTISMCSSIVVSAVGVPLKACLDNVFASR